MHLRNLRGPYDLGALGVVKLSNLCQEVEGLGSVLVSRVKYGWARPFVFV